MGVKNIKNEEIKKQAASVTACFPVLVDLAAKRKAVNG